MKNFDYFKPKSLKEVSDLQLKFRENIHIINGGTDLTIRIRDGLIEPDIVVDIKGIQELKDINFDEKEGLFIGACVTLGDLAKDPIVNEKYEILADAANTVGSVQVRNRATMAGNICNASPLADTATPLLALDAKVVIYSPDGEKEVSIHDFFVWVRKTCLKQGEIVKGIRIPPYDDIIGEFHKISRRNEVDLSTVCASIVKIDENIRMAFGAVAPTPIRTRNAEVFLKDKELTDEFIVESAKIASEDVSPIDDIRASKEYRSEMVEVLTHRGLKAIRDKEVVFSEI